MTPIQPLAVPPTIPVKPDVLSPEGDIYPNFRWDPSSDPDLPTPDDLVYDMEIWRLNDMGTPELKATVYDIDGHTREIPISYTHGSWIMASGVFFEYTTALMGGSYLARIKAVDDEHHEESDWSLYRDFNIIFPAIDPDKIFISAPLFEDPNLGKPRFFDSATLALYNLLKDTANSTLGETL